MKYVVITGGVVSGLGKGITASSVGLLLKECGLRVTAIKIDPYLNIDAGTMSPYEHGEVFVLDDGGEVDLDLGNYERFMHVELTRDHNITTGKVYSRVIDKERKGEYLGKTVQMIPHITNEIQDWIARVASIPVSVDNSGTPEVCIIELGGTVGDIESSVFLEALRQFQFKVGRDNFCHIHVSLIPVLGNVGEQKSKPTQHSMQSLRACGLIPNIIVCRSKQPIDRNIAEKVSLFSMVPFSHVISVHDVSNIYFVPNLLLKQGVVTKVLDILKINKMPPMNIGKFDELALKLKENDNNDNNNVNNGNNDNEFKTDESNDECNEKRTISIGIVGKYTGLSDSYLSVTKALLSASLNCDLRLKIVWIESSHLEYYAKSDQKHQSKSSKKHYHVSKQRKIVKDSRSRSRSGSASASASASASISAAASSNGMNSGDNDENENVSTKAINENDSNNNDDGLPPYKRQRLLNHPCTYCAPKIMDNNKNDSNNNNNNNNNSNFDDSILKPKCHNDYLSYILKENIGYDCKTRKEEFDVAWSKLTSVDGILIPGGFGDRGIEGKIAACRYARRNSVPFLGICLGMQMAVIEYARNVCGMEDCNSEEVNPNCINKCIVFMPEMIDKQMGGSMRLGKRTCHLEKDSLIYWLYNEKCEIYERHRHRYEVNPLFIDNFEKNGLNFTGKDDLKERMEVIELDSKNHPYYVGCQFHPEFKSGPLRPSPPFIGLIKAAAGILHHENDTIDTIDAIDASDENSNTIVHGNEEKKDKRKNDGKMQSDCQKDGRVLVAQNLNTSFDNDKKQNV